jgi:hypothetical protein
MSNCQVFQQKGAFPLAAMCFVAHSHVLAFQTFKPFLGN